MKKIDKPFLNFDSAGKVLVVPMNHSKRIELINFLSFLYLDEPFESKDFMREALNGCYMIVISDIGKNELKSKISFH